MKTDAVRQTTWMHHGHPWYGDSLVRMGKSHYRCDDDAVVGCRSSRAWAVVSDGCSASADSDIGARLLARSSARILYTMDHVDIPTVARGAHEMCLDTMGHMSSLGFPEELMDATLVMALADATTGVLSVGISGDGMFLVLFDDGTTELVSLISPGNSPYYLSYHHAPERHALYREHFPGMGSLSMTGRSGCTTTVDNDSIIPVITYPLDHVMGFFVASDGYLHHPLVDFTGHLQRMPMSMAYHVMAGPSTACTHMDDVGIAGFMRRSSVRGIRPRS
jgi:hypothetical protein